jgi:glyoxylase-like metal-dependent hydrolase (beta-lactamase superfamily II)
MRYFLSVLTGLVISAGLGYHYYVGDGDLPETTTYVIDMDKIRSLAKAPVAELPRQVTVVKIADNTVPAGALIAGAGWGDAVMARYSFQIVYPDSHVVLETGMTQEQSEFFDSGVYYAEAFEPMMKAIETADLIIATHEHIDHIGALAVHPRLRDIAGKALVSREQLEWAERVHGVVFPPWFVADYAPLEFDSYYRAAPGLVLIKATGHTPGSLMAFVSFADGSEALFVGDVVFTMANITRQTARPRFMSEFIVKEDRSTVLDQVRALVDLHEREPNLKFVVSHDGAQIESYMLEGWMKPLPLSQSASEVNSE